LENQDVDFEAGVLVIRESKFGKSRLVPVHKSVVTALGKYARARNRTFPLPCCSAFFVSDRGIRRCHAPTGTSKPFRNSLNWPQSSS
jgi:integrase